jgi:hypothetical protein
MVQAKWSDETGMGGDCPGTAATVHQIPNQVWITWFTNAAENDAEICPIPFVNSPLPTKPVNILIV